MPLTAEQHADRIMLFLGCSGDEAHDPPPCHLCKSIRERLEWEFRSAIMEAANEPRGAIPAVVVPATSHQIRVADTRQRAAEKATGRVPAKGDRVRKKADPVMTVYEVTDAWVYFAEGGGAAREYLAKEYEYLPPLVSVEKDDTHDCGDSTCCG